MEKSLLRGTKQITITSRLELLWIYSLYLLLLFKYSKDKIKIKIINMPNLHV